MSDLLSKKCIPCEGGMELLTREQVEKYLADGPAWELSEDEEEGLQITKRYKFKDFIGAIDFVNKVADIAEMEGHHPDIKIKYNKVKLINWTHAIGGLSEN